MTPTEEFVYELCQKTFLPFWSFPTPFKNKKHELCDVLIVCSNIVIIISVKEVGLSTGKSEEVQYNRWIKKAVDKSVDQLYGADRYIKTTTTVLNDDQKEIISLPPIEGRSVYRIAVPFGKKSSFPLTSGDFGKGIVHVIDEGAILTLFSELDTISDFVEYLDAKESLLNRAKITLDSELDLLAFHFTNGLGSMPQANMMMLDSGLWSSYVKTDNYKKWRTDIKDGFVWDEMISSRFNYLDRTKQPKDKMESLEMATRHINLEKRMNRVVLAEQLADAIEKGVRSRLMYSKEGEEHAYVYLKTDEVNWETKEKELIMRCMVARVKLPSIKRVIGIGIGVHSQHGRYYDNAFFEMEDLSEEFIQRVNLMAEEFNYFQGL